MEDKKMNETVIPSNKKVNWRQVGLFLLLTFLLSWILDLLLYLTAGYGSNATTLIALQLQMLVPAFFAILLSVFFFKNKAIYFRNFHERPRWFFYFYLAFTLLYVAMLALVFVAPEQAGIASAITSSLSLLGLLVLIALRAFSGREAFARAGLKGGRFKDWLLYGLAFVLFYAAQSGLNALFGLGQAVDPLQAMQSLGGNPAGMSPQVFMLVAGVQTVLVGSLAGLIIAFGEEYGWRGYLQSELVKIGKVRGVLLLGLIWSVWHYPVIWMGHNYPGEPLWGTLLMTVYTTSLAFVLGYVMLKTGSIWLVAFLHALNNQTASYFLALVYQPQSPVWSFGSGVFGLLILVPIVLLILRDPVWQDTPRPEQPELQPSAIKKPA
jgi:membrane protease YdiL (CAAX protease family)